MKASELKNLIKEAVREEIQDILKEAVREASTPSNAQPVAAPKPVAVKKTFSGDPIQEMLQQTAANMSRSDYQNVMGGGAPSMASSMASSMGMTNAEPGLDISQLDFVKKAGAIYNESINKDKQRLM